MIKLKYKDCYYIKLYQVFECFGYITEDTVISEVYDCFNNLPIIISPEFKELSTIIVKKRSPFLVQEILTGLTFPIVNIYPVSSKLYPMYGVEKPMKESHTFVISKGDKLIANKLNNHKELGQYREKHPDINVYKKELQTIINLGKQNMDNKKTKKRTLKLK